jgi:hypothetical protein
VIRRLILVALLALVAAAPSATPATTGGSLFYGFTEDLPKEIGADAVRPAAELGARAFRITLMWEPGQTQLAAADITKLNRATSAASGMRLVLAVYANAGSKAPLDSTARTQYCTYVRSALSRYRSIVDVVIWNEPNKNLFWNQQANAPAAYEALLARCWDVLHAFRADVNVIGLALGPRGNDDAGSTSVGEFIRKLGQTYRGSGRTKPILDTVAHHVYGNDATERPWRKHIESKFLSLGDWNKLMYNLWLAFDGTAQPLPGACGVRCVSIWYLEGGVQTTVDPEHASAYSGTENVKVLVPDFAGGETGIPSETSPAPDQYTQVLDSARLAACQSYIGAYFNFLLFDEPVLIGWQSGAYWADRTPKDSLPAFRQVIAEINAGAVDCNALKGGPPSADFMPPTAPANVAGAASRDPLRVELSWTASTDDASAISYRVYRNGAHVGTTATTAWTNTAVAPATTYTYIVRALDAAGNLGAASPPLTVTTPSDTVEQTFVAVEDAYVRSNAPGENAGSATNVRVYRNSSRETHSYLKFAVSGAATISRATLRLYVIRASPVGGTVFAGASSDWSEQTVTWQSRPAVTGSAVASAGAVAAGQWVEVDVSSLVRGPGTYTLVLKDGSDPAAWYASSETAQPPQLVTR